MLKIYSKRENEDDYVYLGPYKLSFVIKFIDEDQEHLCGLQLLNLENQIYIQKELLFPKECVQIKIKIKIEKNL